MSQKVNFVKFFYGTHFRAIQIEEIYKDIVKWHKII